MKALYIVDFSNWVYKFKYTFNLGVDLDGGAYVDTSVLHGFNIAIKSQRFDDIVIALDGCPIRSLDILPQYKQQREHSKSDKMYVPKKEVLQFLTKLGEVYGKRVRVVASYGQEADQVIASLASIALGKVPHTQRWMADAVAREHSVKEDPYLSHNVEDESPLDLDTDYNSVVIGSTDSDMYQLKALGDVFMDSSWSGSKIDYSENTPKAVHNMPANTIAIYKAFLGDTSDNVPAVVPTRRGKTVRDLIVRFLNTEESFLNFCSCLRLGLQIPSELILLKRWVLEEGGVDALRRNYSVVKLGFESTPCILSYPTYSIQDTIDKYRLRVKR